MSLIIFRTVVIFFEVFCSILAMLILLGYDLKTIWRKTLVFGLIWTIPANLTYLINIESIRNPINWIISIIIYKIVFRDKWWISIRNFWIAAFIFAIPPGIVGQLILEWIMGPYQNVFQTSVQFWFIAALILPPIFSLNILIAFLLRRAGKRWAYLLIRIKPGSQDFIFFIAIFLQTALVFWCIDTTGVNIKLSSILFGAWMIIIGLNVYIMYHTIRSRERIIMTSAEEVISSSVTDFFNTIRSQRHDFSNHLQVIAALNHNNRKDELEAYIADLNSEVSSYNQVLKVDNPFVSALVNAKMARADAGRIRFEMEAKTPLADTTRNILAIVSILGNLLDNAIEAVEPQGLDDKWVRLVIHKKGPFLILEVSNPGTIEPEIASSLFRPGFTSKGQFHDGLGLYSARELARKMGGCMEFYSENNAITFSLLIPK